jgi:hypothetical protein
MSKPRREADRPVMEWHYMTAPSHARSASAHSHSRPQQPRPERRFTGTSRTLFAVGEVLRSQLAMHAVGPARRTLCIATPPRSTANGARSKQLLSLVTLASELPCGWLDLINARCVLTSYARLVAYQARHGQHVEFTHAQYEAIIDWLARTFAPLQVTVVVTA